MINNESRQLDSVNNPLLRLSKYRSSLMGLAILWVFVFHFGSVGNTLFDRIQMYGYGGVDVFIFLSSIGLCYSMSHDNNVKSFYKKRIRRIVPTWLFVLVTVHLFGVVGSVFMYEMNMSYPHTFFQCLGWYTGLGFYISTLFRFEDALCWFYEWYVPTILLFYSIFPFLNKLRTNQVVLLFITLFLLGLIAFANDFGGALHLCYLRLPLFLFGIITYRIMFVLSEKQALAFLLLVFLIGICSVYLYYTGYAPFPIFYVFLFLIPPLCVLVTYFLVKPLIVILAFVGSISFELYLIHIYRRPQFIVEKIIDNQFLSFVATLILCICLSWSLHLIINSLFAKLK